MLSEKEGRGVLFVDLGADMMARPLLGRLATVLTNGLITLPRLMQTATAFLRSLLMSYPPAIILTQI